ncbi:MAG: TonB-dependent receptor, partial [Saprospiraceae bacterium]|nr:TonB-dependent receptor [Saprospiraceae bacterium]
MKKFTSRLQVILLWLCICIAMVESNAQSVQGVVLDEQNSPLASASIIALSSADSVMGGFALTDVQGRFRIENLKEGAFTLQVSFLGYLDSYSDINVIKGESKRIPDIVLKEGQMKLDEVVITADHVPLKMKNDTLQYNADAFNVKAHEAVEDLLKRLPGVEVAKDGSIKAQGEDVGKVLVEGKEFFGNDPTIATRNLPADAVDKVEVFDKKSEMAEFSGIDDGMEQKTINLSLKEDKKKGFFGNGKGGYGTEDRFDAKFNVNSFKGDATWTAIGTANNINAQGFSIMDYIDFMGGLGAMGGSGGRIELNSNDVGIALGQNMDQGFMNTISGGVNYNYDLSGNSDLSASYFYTRLDNDIDKTTFRQNILNEDTYETDENSVQNMLNSGHTLNLKYKQKRDSSYRLTIGGRLIYGDGSSSVELNRVLNSVALQNQTMSSSLSDRQRINLNANGTYSARLKKKGRIFSLNGDLKSRDQDGTGLIQSYNAFFAGATSTFDTLRQRQLTLNNSLDYSIRASFTEPLGRGRYLEFNLNHQNVNNDYRKDFFDLVRMGSEDGVFNQFLSDRFDRQFLYSRAGVNYKLNRKKYNLTLGLNFQYSDQKGDIGSSEVDLSRDYFSVLPVLRFDYDFHTSSSLRFNYFTNIREPSLEQLQPQVNNADPLNLYQGNPELRTEYRHQFRLNY